MGLDYSIDLICKIVNKDTKEVVNKRRFEICYWRKCWHLCQTIIHNFAAESEHMISKDDDFKVVCKPEIIPEIENLILEELKDYNSAAWSDSIWDIVRCRRATYKQLEYLTSFRNFLENRDNIDDLLFDKEIPDDAQIEDFINNYLKDENYRNSHTIEYEIEFINSY